MTMAAVLGWAGCSGDAPTGPPPGPPSTWATIQNEILTPQCTAACHTAGTAFARQSDLVLTPDVAYDQLVNRAPHNTAAAGDGLLLVGTHGLESQVTSFLWEKVNAPAQAHFYGDHPQYGALMPLGAPVLTNGELAYVREWILAGAPRDGVVADEALLEDETRYAPPVFVALAPPTQGVQLHVGPFSVSPRFEREFYYLAPVGDPEDLLVNRIEVSMRPGSHHLNLYTFDADMPQAERPEPGVYRDIRDAEGNYIRENLTALQWNRFLAGTQIPNLSYAFPPGIALRVPHIGGIDVNAHYVNRGDAPMEGEIYVNLHTVDPGAVQRTAELLDLSSEDLNLPPRQVTTLKRSFAFGERRHIFLLYSHAHEHMTAFRVFAVRRDASQELVYFADDWAHPPILELDPPLTLDEGEGLRLEVTYDNRTDRVLRYGLLSEDEMLILFGYYYTD